MALWTIAVIFVLVLAIIGIAVLTFFVEESNKKKQQANILYPFSGHLTPPSPPWDVNSNNISPGAGKNPQEGLALLGARGGSSFNEPQIQCPSGYKVNIVGAFIEVADPYGQCSTKSDSQLQMTCGTGVDLTTAAGCSTDTDCGVGMECNKSQGVCVPKTCKSNSDCSGTVGGSILVKACSEKLGDKCGAGTDCGEGMKCVNGKCEVDPGSGACMACIDGYCASMPTCSYVKDGLNTTCSPFQGDKFKCRPRDASAYLAKHCDGKDSCLGPDDVWLPQDPNGAFGPLPCKIPARSGDPHYSTLPITTGWGGGAPNNGQGQVDPTFTQGYYVHGIYSCVPDDE
ncbi:MAG: hypothetical protein ACOC4M_17800 [Promethearchaeia archaeon]